METRQCILQRRSVRRFTDQDVTNEQIAELMRAANYAPSWANTQCWEFVVVRDSAVKEKLAATMPEANPARKVILNAPVVIVACAQLGKSGFYNGSATTSKSDNWYLYDLGMATQNISLAAHDMGLGSVVLGLFDTEAAGQALNLPDSVEVVTLIPLGVPVKEGQVPSRKPLCEFVFQDQYEKAWVSSDEQNLCFIEDRA